MAQFRGTLQGDRGQASRLGSKRNGLRATVNGWQSGLTVRASINAKGEDVFTVELTGGSNGGREGRQVLRIVDGKVRRNT